MFIYWWVKDIPLPKGLFCLLNRHEESLHCVVWFCKLPRSASRSFAWIFITTVNSSPGFRKFRVLIFSFDWPSLLIKMRFPNKTVFIEAEHLLIFFYLMMISLFFLLFSPTSTHCWLKYPWHEKSRAPYLHFHFSFRVLYQNYKANLSCAILLCSSPHLVASHIVGCEYQGHREACCSTIFLQKKERGNCKVFVCTCACLCFKDRGRRNGEACGTCY